MNLLLMLIGAIVLTGLTVYGARAIYLDTKKEPKE